MTGLGPWINVTSGIAAYPWLRFLFWDALGEILWVVLFVCLGYIFSDSVQALIEILLAAINSYHSRAAGLKGNAKRNRY